MASPTDIISGLKHSAEEIAAQTPRPPEGPEFPAQTAQLVDNAENAARSIMQQLMSQLGMRGAGYAAAMGAELMAMAAFVAIDLNCDTPGCTCGYRAKPMSYHRQGAAASLQRALDNLTREMVEEEPDNPLWRT